MFESLKQLLSRRVPGAEPSFCHTWSSFPTPQTLPGAYDSYRRHIFPTFCHSVI